MKVNDIVGRKSYNKDIIFKIKDIVYDSAILQGLHTRLVASAPLDDLVLISENEIRTLENNESNFILDVVKNKPKFDNHITGKILHIDSDLEYLKKCMNLYSKMQIHANGVYLKPESIALNIINIIEQTSPDIIIITGHDSYNNRGIYNIDNYSNSKYYKEAVKKIRQKYSKDHIFVFAGACQSFFEELIGMGANFASSPKRVNIDVFDPAIVAIKAATTSFNDVISLGEIFLHSQTKKEGISGFESLGKMRLLL